MQLWSWGTWTRTKTNGTRNRRAANYPIPQGEARTMLADPRAGVGQTAARRRASTVSLPSSAIDSGSGGAMAEPVTATRTGA